MGRGRDERGKEESLGKEGKRGKGNVEKGKGREREGRNGGGAWSPPQAKAVPRAIFLVLYLL